MRKKINYFFHPLFFGILPSIILYLHNINEVWPNILIKPIFYSIVFVLISWTLFYLILRNIIKTSLITSIWTILFFSYGHIYLLTTEKGFFNLIPFGPNAVLLTIYFLIFTFLLFFILKNNKDLIQINGLFNFVSIVLILLNLAIIVPKEIKKIYALIKLKKYLIKNQEKVSIKNLNIKSYPDIYYLVFDRYANESILKKYFNFDNSQFTIFLKEKNFYIAEKSFANYPSTFVSLASSLNMSHLSFLTEVLGENYSDKAVIYSTLIERNAVVEFLKARGYRYLHFGDNWPPTKINYLADENYNKFLDLDEFQLYLYENTLLNTLTEKIFSKRVYSGVIRLYKIIDNLDFRVKALEQKITSPGPKFVFAHFLLPHPPYLFSDNCRPLDFKIVRKRTNEVGYISQTNCANKKIKYLVEQIKKKSSRPAVIILQSDEGPYLPDKYFNNEQYSKKFSKESYTIHSRILNAYYLPDRDRVKKTVDYQKFGLYKFFTPVNTFRLIFNYYFKTDFPLVENRSFIFKDNRYPLKMTEITGLLIKKN